MAMVTGHFAMELYGASLVETRQVLRGCVKKEKRGGKTVVDELEFKEKRAALRSAGRNEITVTITGGPGVGKTELAMKLAYLLRKEGHEVRMTDYGVSCPASHINGIDRFTEKRSVSINIPVPGYNTSENATGLDIDKKCLKSAVKELLKLL